MNWIALAQTAADPSPLREYAPFLATVGLGVAVLLGYIVVRRNPHAPRRRFLGAPNTAPPAQSRNETVRELQELMQELDDLARGIHGRIDAQFAKLEAVMRDADERVDSLRRLLRASRGQSTLDVTVGNETDALDAPPIVERPDAASETESHPNPSNTERHADIYSLADAGRTVSQIAAQVSRPKGEVELILALRRARQRSENPTATFQA